MVAIAMRYLGVPYQWGGASPKTGFDCSGLVRYVFAQLGVSLIHYAAAQWHAPGGVWVAPNRLQPGDLVFFTGSDGTRKEPGHVGIYVDDGYIIDAPHTGAVVRIDSLDEPKFANQYVGARRLDIQPSDVRHLLHVATPGVSATGIPLGFPRPMTLAGAPGLVSARTAAVGGTSHGPWIWAGAASGVVLLAFCAGGLLVRRRRPETDTSAEASN